MQHIHTELVTALRAHSAESRKMLSVAKLKAAELTATLPQFYSRLGRRAEHFRDSPGNDDDSTRARLPREPKVHLEP